MSETGLLIHDENGRFIAGNNASRGRPKGARSKITELFFEDLYAKWQEKGSEAIDAMIETRPHEFVKCVASIMPKEFKLEAGKLSDINDDDLLEALEAVRALMAQRIEARKELPTLVRREGK